MHDEDFRDDVRGKLILQTSAAIEKKFELTASMALVVNGHVLKLKGFIPVKEAITYLVGIKKTPISQLTIDELELYHCLR